MSEVFDSLRKKLSEELMKVKNENEDLVTEMMKTRQATALAGLETEGLRERLNNLYKSMTKLYKIKKIQTFYEAFIGKL